jgi:hypothetical protein
LKTEGWRAIKYRAHFQTKKDDIRLVEATRKLVGDDFEIMCDANQATNSFLSPSVQWDFRRAVETARAYQQLGVYWLEEPLPRYDYEQLAELNRLRPSGARLLRHHPAGGADQRPAGPAQVRDPRRIHEQADQPAHRRCKYRDGLQHAFDGVVAERHVSRGLSRPALE